MPYAEFNAEFNAARRFSDKPRPQTVLSHVQAEHKEQRTRSDMGRVS